MYWNGRKRQDRIYRPLNDCIGIMRVFLYNEVIFLEDEYISDDDQNDTIVIFMYPFENETLYFDTVFTTTPNNSKSRPLYNIRKYSYSIRWLIVELSLSSENGFIICTGGQVDA